MPQFRWMEEILARFESVFQLREATEDLAKFLQLGHTELFSAKISRINPEAHPEKRICVTVKINKKGIILASVK